MKPLRCILADDEPLALRLLEAYVGRSPQLVLAGAFSLATDALEAIRTGNADVAFLDIQMPQMNGIELARAAADSGVRVVFVTAYRDFAVEGFRVNALDYLLKPVSFSEFSEAVGRAVEALAPTEPAPEPCSITVRSDYRQVRINFDELLYVEGLKDYAKFYIVGRDRPVLSQMSLKSVEQALPASRFMRVHRSFILGLDHIDSFGRAQARVASVEIPIGETYRGAFLNRMNI